MESVHDAVVVDDSDSESSVGDEAVTAPILDGRQVHAQSMQVHGAYGRALGF